MTEVASHLPVTRRPYHLAKAIGVAEAARQAGKSVRTCASGAPCNGSVGSLVGAGQSARSPLDMLLDGEMFDRSFGKATQPVEGSLTYGISEQLAELFRGNEGNTLGAEIARRALPAPNGQLMRTDGMKTERIKYAVIRCRER
jgi:hypothetical protein